ncbi:glycosyltransferase family 4 protein [Cellulomonas hominis]|uniref:glycosyltransferase family 4 protein n=1 Tax=Cellulomonas hominis TaxID=156981 RepID=UPI0014441040|nr:glycosyltransferase family 1 protein [Cellulomonas hominis]NKY10648.1 glycosyltransferase family 4 protein [Cellulomonas hominis]
MPTPLRVALTVEQCWQPVPGGSGEYVAALTRALRDRDGSTRVVGLAARHGVDDRPRPPVAGPVEHSRLPRPILYEAWNRWRRPSAERTTGAVDVVHATTWAVPGTRSPLVVTVHDLAFLRDPTHFTSRGVRYFRRALDVVRAEAARVVVPSTATLRDCESAGIDASRVEVIAHGVDAPEVSEAAVREWRHRAGVHRPYVLWCGTMEPRKNVARLVRAFAAARRASADADLVLVGPDGWGDAAREVADAVAEAPAGSVHRLGRLSRADLQAALAGAAVFAYPSVWEGFGMPVLEAMAHGTPVVTSAGTSMAEVLGGLGTVVDPVDVDALAEGLVHELARPRAELGALRARAAGYTWAASADRHVAVYREVAGR